MNISINVLPNAQKEKRAEEKKIGFVLRMGLSLAAVLLLLNAVLFLMQVILSIEYQAARKSSEVTLQKKGGKENQSENVLSETNKQVGSLKKIEAHIPKWSHALTRVSEICPADVRITSLEAEENHLKMSGFSKTREAFLDFQEKLKAEGYQFSVNISNLVASKDFNFDLEMTVPEEYLARE